MSANEFVNSIVSQSFVNFLNSNLYNEIRRTEVCGDNRGDGVWMVMGMGMTHCDGDGDD